MCRSMTRRKDTTRPRAARRELRIALFDRGLTMTDWCRQHGYKPTTVHEVLRRYEVKPSRVPRGQIAMQIYHDLEDEFGIVLLDRAA